jgi:uncharacterized membrane protein
MMSQNNDNDQVVVGYFPDADAADAAAKALMSWDDANDDIKLGTIGRLVEKDNGSLEAKHYGNSRAGRGALIGGAIGIVGAAFTGGLSVLAGTLLGGAAGGAMGKLTAGDLGMTDEYLDEVKAKMSAGNAALVVLCDDDEAEATMAKLEDLGGEAHGFGVSKKVLEAIHNTRADYYADQQEMKNDTYMIGGV